MDSASIAAQLYTVRAHTQTPTEIARTLRKVKALGYNAVQLSALGPIEPQQLSDYLDDANLAVCATHVSFDRLRRETEKIIAEHQLWKCEHVAIGSMPTQYRNRDGYHRFGRELSHLGKELAAGDLTLSYHNHSFELEHYGDLTGLEILFNETDPAFVTAEIDTYWIQHGGGEPAQWIRRMAGRVPLVHLKDMTIRSGQQTFAEVGEGNLDWAAIIGACRDAGTDWYIVEQDECDRDPFESLRISLRNLRDWALS